MQVISKNAALYLSRTLYTICVPIFKVHKFEFDAKHRFVAENLKLRFKFWIAVELQINYVFFSEIPKEFENLTSGLQNIIKIIDPGGFNWLHFIFSSLNFL